MSTMPILMYVLSHETDNETINTHCQSFSRKNPNVKFQTFTNVFSCAKRMIACECDILFIDDRLFDTFISSLETLKSKEVFFTQKRFVVFSHSQKFSENRILELSLSGVRSTFIGLKKFPTTFDLITTQIIHFQKTRPKISLCLSGGGFDGYMYTLGVCYGLERCLEDFQMKDFDIFCGISSGSILSACFAGGVNTHDLVQQAYKKHPGLTPIRLGTLLDLAITDLVKSAYKRKIPIGIFKGEKLRTFFTKQIEYFGVEDSLDVIKKNLYIFGTDQDTGEAVIFGKNPWKENIKISQAIRASIALPPFYLPANINGHWFTDGQLASSTNFDLPIQEKSSLVVVIDPIVAFSTSQAGGVKKRGGYFTILQAIKSLIHSRSDIVLQHARDKHPDVDFIKFQPTHEIMEMMSGNPMRIPIRTELIEVAAEATCRQIAEHYDSFQHKFAKHGLILKLQNPNK